MNSESTTLPAAPVLKIIPPRLRPTRFEDYPQIQPLESAYLSATLPVDDWRGLFLSNPVWPRVGKQWPIGWVLENSLGRVVGSIANIPTLYHFRGRELICATGRHWVVAPEYRAFALQLMNEHFNQEGVDLFINTTAGVKAVAAASMFSPRVPAGDWETFAYWVTGHRGLARTALRKFKLPLADVLAVPTGFALWLKDALFLKRLPAVPSVVVESEEGFDSRFDLFWQELIRRRPEKLLSVRDSKTLSWHFDIPKRMGRLWLFTATRNGLLRAYCVLKRQNVTHEMRRMRLVDYQTLDDDADLLPALLRAALRRCAAEDIHVFDHPGRGLPEMRAFDAFAPYRRKLANWPFFAHAADPSLDAELRKPEAWFPSSYDGDASLE